MMPPGSNIVRSPAAHRLRSIRGLTIVEVVTAMLILALAITTGLAAMQRAFLQLDAARNLQIAASILQCEMEKERLLPWSQVSDAGYQPAIDVALLRDPAVAGRFTLSRTVTAVSDQLVQVTLSATWRTFEGRSVTRTYTSYFCQNGLYNWIYSNV